jgi:integrase
LDYLRARHSLEILDKYKVQVPTILDKYNRHHHRIDDSDGDVAPPPPKILERFRDGLKKYMLNARKYSTVARDYTLFKLLELEGLRIFESTMLEDTCRRNLLRRQELLGFTEEEIFSAHQLRHAFATRLTESEVDLLTLKTLLGHADVGTTLTYSNPGSDYLEKRIRLAQGKWKK